jgi:Tol biopolymer transport system component
MFSPTGSDVYYVQGRAGSSWTGSLYRLPVAGTSPSLVTENISGRIAFSHDGRRIAFIRIDMTPRMESLLVANADGSGQRVVATRRSPRYFARDGLTWSPDEHSIVCLAGNASYYNAHAFRLVEIAVDGGSERPLTAAGWAWPGSVMWARDRHSLIVSAGSSEDWGQVWRVSYPGGKIHRITNDLGDYTKLTQTADSKTLLAVRREQTEDLWLTPAAYRGQPVQIPAADLRGLSWAVWVSGQQIIFSALAGDSRNIWTMDAQGGNRRQLTTADFDQTEMAVSRDQRYLAYFAEGHIWRANLDGSGARQLTHGALDVHPAFSPDGRWVVYASFSDWSPAIGGQPMLWKVPVDGGDPVQLTSDNTSLPDVSPDGKSIACAFYRYDRPNQPTRIAIYPFAGGPATKYFDRPPGAGESVYWNADGAALDYVVSAYGVGNVWRQPLDGSPPAPITAFHAGRILFRTLSPDKKMLLLGRGQQTNDLVLLSDLQ